MNDTDTSRSLEKHFCAIFNNYCMIFIIFAEMTHRVINKMKNKLDYEPPQMTVVEIHLDHPLLQASKTNYGNGGEYVWPDQP